MRPTAASESSSTPILLPTPEANQASNGGSQHPDKRQGIGGHSIQLQDVVEHMLPTPKSSDGNGARSHGDGGDGLREVASLLPTPKIKDRAMRSPAADGGPDLGEAVALLNSPTGSEGTGIGAGRRRASTLRGQVDDLSVLPTPRVAATRTSRSALVPDEHNHWAAPSLEQVSEMLDGDLPREYENSGEVKGAARDLLLWDLCDGPPGHDTLLPTPAAHDSGNTPEQHLRKKPGRTQVTSLAVMASGGLLPTPVVTDAASTRNATAGRREGAPHHAGQTLLDAVDLLPTPRAARGASGTETMYALGAERSDADRPQGEVLLPTPTTEPQTGNGHARNLGKEAQLLPTPRASDGTNGGPGQRGSSGDLMLPSAALHLMPTPDASMGGAGGRAGDPEKNRERGHQVTINEVAQHLPTPSTAGGGERTRGGDRSDELLLAGVAQERAGQWGPYEAAIRRWETVLGRPAPWATEPSPRSKKGRLSPRFVEWMMGWAEGWVCSLKLSRNQQLKILGNGVVPQQATEAIRFLLTEPARRETPRRTARTTRRTTPRAWLKAAEPTRTPAP